MNVILDRLDKMTNFNNLKVSEKLYFLFMQMLHIKLVWTIVNREWTMKKSKTNKKSGEISKRLVIGALGMNLNQFQRQRISFLLMINLAGN